MEATLLHPSLQLTFYSFVVALCFKASAHQRFAMRQNGSRESHSGVNWPVSAQLVKLSEANERM